MKILFWDTDEPKNRIVLSGIFVIAATLLARTIIGAASAVKNLEIGAIHPITIRGRTHFLTDASLYVVYLIIALVCVAIVIMAVNAVIIAMRWFRRHNAR